MLQCKYANPCFQCIWLLLKKNKSLFFFCFYFWTWGLYCFICITVSHEWRISDTSWMCSYLCQWGQGRLDHALSVCRHSIWNCHRQLLQIQQWKQINSAASHHITINIPAHLKPISFKWNHLQFTEGLHWLIIKYIIIRRLNTQNIFWSWTNTRCRSTDSENLSVLKNL